MCHQPDLNRHSKALAIELQGHVRLAVCTTIVIICEVYCARSHRQVATLPSGTGGRSWPLILRFWRPQFCIELHPHKPPQVAHC